MPVVPTGIQTGIQSMLFLVALCLSIEFVAAEGGAGVLICASHKPLAADAAAQKVYLPATCQVNQPLDEPPFVDSDSSLLGRRHEFDAGSPSDAFQVLIEVRLETVAKQHVLKVSESHPGFFMPLVEFADVRIFLERNHASCHERRSWIHAQLAPEANNLEYPRVGRLLVELVVELVRRSPSRPADDRVTVTTVESRQMADGGTEHGAVGVEVYENGELVPPPVPSPDATPPFDGPAFEQRLAQVRELFPDFDRTISEDAFVPRQAYLVFLNHRNGLLLAQYAAMNPDFREQLLQADQIDPEHAQLLAIQKAESLTADDLAPWLSHKAFREYRRRR